eukprot:UN28312
MTRIQKTKSMVDENTSLGSVLDIIIIMVRRLQWQKRTHHFRHPSISPTFLLNF